MLRRVPQKWSAQKHKKFDFTIMAINHAPIVRGEREISDPSESTRVIMESSQVVLEIVRRHIGFWYQNCQPVGLSVFSVKAENGMICCTAEIMNHQAAIWGYERKCR